MSPTPVCAPAPTFIAQPTSVTITYGSSANLNATVSVSYVAGGVPRVQWQLSTDGEATWANVPGDSYVETSSAPVGQAFAYTSFNPSVSQSGAKFRAVATTCGGTATSNSATLTVNPAALTIIANNKAMSGGAMPVLDATYGDPTFGAVLRNGDTAASLVGTLTCTTTATAYSAAGTYPIKCGGQSSPNYTITYRQGTLTVTNAIQVILFDLSKLPAKSPVDAPFDISGYALATSGLPVSFSNATPSVCTVTGTTVTLLALGTCTINADQGGNSDFPAAPQVQLSFTVGKKPIKVVASSGSQPFGTTTAPTITCTSTDLATFPTPPTGRVYARLLLGTEGFTYRPIAVNSSTPMGNYITRCSGGDPGSNYSISSYTDGTFTVTAAVPTTTITANDQSYTYGAPPPTLDVTYSRSSNSLTGTPSCGVYAKSDTAYSSPIALSSSTPVVSGGYAVHCSGLSDPSYTLIWKDGTLTVNPAPLAITAGDGTISYGGTVPSITPSYNGFVNGDDASALTTGPTCSTTATTASGVGAYATLCSSAAASNYTISGYTSGTFTITPATLIVTPASNGSMVYGSRTVPAVAFQITGFQNGESSSVVTQLPTCASTAAAYNGTTAGSGSPVGSYSIACSGGGAGSNYTFSYNPSHIQFAVTAAPLTVTANNQSTIYGGTLPQLTWHATFVNGDTAASLTTAPLCSTVPATSHAGSYGIACSGAASSNYTIAYGNGSLTVNPAKLTIVATDRAMTYGGSQPALSWSANFVNGDTTATMSTSPNAAPMCSTAAASGPAGTYSIACSGAADSDYTISYLNGTLTVNRASTSTALATSSNPTASGSAVIFTATMSVLVPGGGIPTGTVTFKDGSTTVGTGSLTGLGKATLTMSTLAIGAHSVTASYNGDHNFVGSASEPLTQNVDTNLGTYRKLAGGAYNLANASLSNAYLYGWNLAGASLKNGTFQSGNFSYATLTNADLKGATLTNANFTGANLKGATNGNKASLTGAIWSSTVCPDGTTTPVTGGTCVGHL